MTFADGKSASKPTDSLGINDAVGDQAQRTSYEVGAYVPVWRTRAGFWMATATRSKPGGLGCSSTRVETHMMRLRRLRGANGPTVDTR
ncbi:MAG: hypothetical protein AUH89_03810 [Ktedonobacter sp. 13_1_40CM_4_52_4]|nr:MAG: hypothetical protein AUH89_03810 [Ktedonobacter sp. 13_1_40CM_4_52_4]